MRAPKLSSKSPVRSRICLRNSKLINRQPAPIPQIRVELDDMLNDAYKELRIQPKKNIILGHPTDICIIDNNILKDYVHAIYSEYNLTDPMKPEYQQQSQKRHIKSISESSKSSKHFITPKKSMKIQENKEKTQYKGKSSINKLKKDMRKQLNEKEELGFSGMRSITLKSVYQDSDNEERVPLQKPRKLKIKLNQSRRNRMKSLSNQSEASSLQDSQFDQKRYCLFCDQQIISISMSQHIKSCSPIHDFIGKMQNISVSTVIEHISTKINALNNRLLSHSSSLKNSANNLEFAIKEYITQSSEPDELIEQASPIHKLDQDLTQLLKDGKKAIEIVQFYKESVIMKCYKELKYLQYLKKVRKQFMNCQSELFLTDKTSAKEQIAIEIGLKFIGYSCTP